MADRNFLKKKKTFDLLTTQRSFRTARLGGFARSSSIEIERERGTFALVWCMDSAFHIQKKMKRKNGEVDLLSLPRRPAITAPKAFTHITYTEQQEADWKTIFSLLLHSSSILNEKIDGRLLPVEPDLLDCYGAFWHQHWLMRLKKPFLFFYLFIYLFDIFCEERLFFFSPTCCPISLICLRVGRSTCIF